MGVVTDAHFETETLEDLMHTLVDLHVTLGPFHEELTKCSCVLFHEAQSSNCTAIM